MRSRSRKAGRPHRHLHSQPHRQSGAHNSANDTDAPKDPKCLAPRLSLIRLMTTLRSSAEVPDCHVDEAHQTHSIDFVTVFAQRSTAEVRRRRGPSAQRQREREARRTPDRTDSSELAVEHIVADCHRKSLQDSHGYEPISVAPVRRAEHSGSGTTTPDPGLGPIATRQCMPKGQRFLHERHRAATTNQIHMSHPLILRQVN